MGRAIGVWAAEHIAVGVVHDGRLTGPLRTYPEDPRDASVLQSMPSEEIAELISQQIAAIAEGESAAAVGIGFPGIVIDGVVEESPNLPQVKGYRLAETVAAALSGLGRKAPVLAINDAEAIAAGIASTRGYLDRLVRVWTLGDGIGFGRYPRAEGVWEGGHSVVSLDPKERYCGCGGHGHLEGIMGSRAMRLRFLDLEPDEIFGQAKTGESRCTEFVHFWHRALAAASATSIHMDGAGKFFVGGPNARFLDVALLNQYVGEMVKMSPLQGYVFEVFHSSDEIGVIGAAVSAEQELGEFDEQESLRTETRRAGRTSPQPGPRGG
ncbi:MAG: ROK family protein [Bryobacteraceae bacterium]|nr:ROK family protein [Bryobacteraceae bacterium]